MMLCDLSDADVVILHEGSDQQTLLGFNIIKRNRFFNLVEKLDDAKHEGGEVFRYVQQRMAEIYVKDLIEKAASDG